METIVIPRLGVLPIRLLGPGPFADVICSISNATTHWHSRGFPDAFSGLAACPINFGVAVDASGRFQLDELTPGTFEVTVARGNRASNFEVTVRPGETFPEREIQWDAQDEWIHGIATYADGRPFTGGAVKARAITLKGLVREGTRTPWCDVDSTGRFRLAKTPGVLYCVGLQELHTSSNFITLGQTVDCQLAWPGPSDGPPIQLVAPPGLDENGAPDPGNFLEHPRLDHQMMAWSRDTEPHHPFHPASLEIHGQHLGRPVLGTVSLRHESGRLTNVDCDDGKPFLRDDLEAGTYEVFVNQLACGTVELAAGESKRLDLHMPVALPVRWDR